MNMHSYVVQQADLWPPALRDSIVYAVEYAARTFGWSNVGAILNYLQQQEDFHHARMREMASEPVEDGLVVGNWSKRFNAHDNERLAAFRAVQIIDNWLVSQKGVNA